MDQVQDKDIIYMPVISLKGTIMILWDCAYRSLENCDKFMQQWWPDLITVGVCYEGIYELEWDPEKQVPALMTRREPWGRIVCIGGPAWEKRFPDQDPSWYQDDMYFLTREGFQKVKNYDKR